MIPSASARTRESGQYRKKMATRKTKYVEEVRTKYQNTVGPVSRPALWPAWTPALLHFHPALLPRRLDVRTHQALIAVLIDGLDAEHYVIDGHIRQRVLSDVADKDLAFPKGSRGRPG